MEDHPLCTLTCLRLEAAGRHTEVKRTPSHLKELQAVGGADANELYTHHVGDSELTLIPLIGRSRMSKSHPCGQRSGSGNLGEAQGCLSSTGEGPDL